MPEMAGVPLAGGLVGYSSYDVVRYFERLPSKARAENPVPDLHYVAPESMLVFDHLTRGIALLHAGDEAERQALRREVIRALRGGLPNYSLPGGGPASAIRPPSARCRATQYMAGVKRTQEYIAAGDVYQLVLSSRFSGRHSLDPFEAYRALRLINPSPYMYYCKLGDVTVVGSSPEALVKLNAAGRRASCGRSPARGRAPRTRWRTSAHERELLADPKENAEHVMLVDLARNDLGRVARAGSVHVDPYRVIERYSHVMHIVSGVQGELAPDRDAFDLFAATFPGRHAGRRAEGARHGDHRRAGAGAARPVRRHGRLLRRARRHGPGDHDPHAGVPRRRIQLPGGRRHRGRQRARHRTRRSARQERGAGARAQARGGGLMSAPVRCC